MNSQAQELFIYFGKLVQRLSRMRREVQGSNCEGIYAMKTKDAEGFENIKLVGGRTASVRHYY